MSYSTHITLQTNQSNSTRQFLRWVRNIQRGGAAPPEPTLPKVMGDSVCERQVHDQPSEKLWDRPSEKLWDTRINKEVTRGGQRVLP